MISSRKRIPSRVRCSRINLATGRRCSTTFSRKCNATRHEKYKHGYASSSADSGPDDSGTDTTVNTDHQSYPILDAEPRNHTLLAQPSNPHGWPLNLATGHPDKPQQRPTTPQPASDYSFLDMAQIDELDPVLAPAITAPDLHAVLSPTRPCQAGPGTIKEWPGQDTLSFNGTTPSFSTLSDSTFPETWPFDALDSHPLTGQDMAVSTNSATSSAQMPGSILAGNPPFDVSPPQDLGSQNQAVTASISAPSDTASSLARFYPEHSPSIVPTSQVPTNPDAHCHLNMWSASGSAPNPSGRDLEQLAEHPGTFRRGRKRHRARSRGAINSKQNPLTYSLRIPNLQAGQQRGIEIRLLLHIKTASGETACHSEDNVGIM